MFTDLFTLENTPIPLSISVLIALAASDSTTSFFCALVFALTLFSADFGCLSFLSNVDWVVGFVEKGSMVLLVRTWSLSTLLRLLDELVKPVVFDLFMLSLWTLRIYVLRCSTWLSSNRYP